MYKPKPEEIRTQGFLNVFWLLFWFILFYFVVRCEAVTHHIPGFFLWFSPLSDMLFGLKMSDVLRCHTPKISRLSSERRKEPRKFKKLESQLWHSPVYQNNSCGCKANTVYNVKRFPKAFMRYMDRQEGTVTLTFGHQNLHTFSSSLSECFGQILNYSL